MIEVKQVCKSYSIANKTYQALNDINLTIKKGDVFGILGTSGAGKSTLLRLLNFLEQPTSGKISIDGVDLNSLSPSELRLKRQSIGMIFQHFNLLQSRTVFDNIALPLELINTPKNLIRERVASLLSWIHLTSHANHYPHQLSGGQKQRVAILRALATQPQLLLCDEPTSALDNKATYSILNLLKEINQTLGVTIIIISHEMDVIKQLCEHAAVLNQGTLIETGSVLQLFAHPSSNITRDLVQKYLHIELPPNIKKSLQPDPAPTKTMLVRLTFVGKESNDPLISTLVKRFAITINIIQANIESIQGVTVGYTVCQFDGDTTSIQNALAYIQQITVTYEVLGYA